MPTYNHFYELPVYKICRSFRKNIAITVKECLPKREDYLLKSQVLGSSRSITANVAEGFGRYHFQENIQFCRQARGSLTETLEHLIVAFDEGYLAKDRLATLTEEYKACLLQLNLYIKYLKTSKEVK